MFHFLYEEFFSLGKNFIGVGVSGKMFIGVGVSGIFLHWGKNFIGVVVSGKKIHWGRCVGNKMVVG